MRKKFAVPFGLVIKVAVFAVAAEIDWSTITLSHSHGVVAILKETSNFSARRAIEPSQIRFHDVVQQGTMKVRIVGA